MKKVLFSLGILACSTLYAQQSPVVNICGTSAAMNELYQTNPQALKEKEAFDKFTQDYIAHKGMAKGTADSFVIPVVFHVYGTSQGGYTINDALIKLALKGVNDDFNGLNSDWGTVHNTFMPVRSTLKIRFALAQKDPLGNATTGIRYYATKSGYGKTTVDAQIAADAWDNYKYMNVYIMYDLYDNGVYNNSGVAWYPNTSMSNAKTARVVYNGQYLATNNTVNPEFASVLTHEFAHFFNLMHTFEGGCTAPNDDVADTPPCTTAQGCHTTATSNAPLNCNSQLVNSENYMDYNTNCYKMFTKGQTDRLEAATQHPARITLWQESNLIATGIHIAGGIASQTAAVHAQVYPNPSNGIFIVDVKGTYNYATIQVTDITGKTVYNHTVNPNNIHTIDLKGKAKGLYFMNLRADGINETHKLVLQ